MAGRRTSLASLAAQKVDDVPGRSDPLLLTLPLSVLVPTRFNPRRNFGTDEDLKAFGLVLKRRQLQPAVVVSRSAYLSLWPDEDENVGSAQYVIANGERRYRGSLAAGLTTLDVVHNEGVAKTRADFLDAILSENNDREDLDPIERALGIETMVTELGGADQVAEHYGKSKGWVSQQRKLLKLTPELQALVSSGELPIRVGRDIAGLPEGEQAAAWAGETTRRQETKAQPRVRAKPKELPPPPEPDRFTAVNQKTTELTRPAPEPEPAPVVVPDPPVVQNPVLNEPEPPAAEQAPQGSPDGVEVPEQRAAVVLVPLPSQDPDTLSSLIIAQLDMPARRRLTELLVDYKIEETKKMRALGQS
jgi:ParB family chromosome partitioning protein